MITIYATVSLRLVTFISKVALYPPSLSVLVLEVAILLETTSKAFPVFRVIFSSFGVWLIRSSPINYKELSAVSYLKNLTIPFGNGIPKPFFAEFTNLTKFFATNFSSLYPPEFILI
jgi:hypothetical protein